MTVFTQEWQFPRLASNVLARGRPPVLLDGQFLKGRDGPNSSAHVMDGHKFGQRVQRRKEA